MQKTTLFYVLAFFMIAAIFSAIFPYPIFSNYTNIDGKVVYEINNYHETELSPADDIAPKILDLDFENISVLLPSEFEIIEPETETSAVVKLVSSKNHADIEPIDEANAKILFEICGQNWSWKRIPVLVKLNENAYLPASLACYPHGFSTTNLINGHLCLHFKNSKTNGTNRMDEKHQENVEKAYEIGQDYLKNML